MQAPRSLLNRTAGRGPAPARRPGSDNRRRRRGKETRGMAGRRLVILAPSRMEPAAPPEARSESGTVEDTRAAESAGPAPETPGAGEAESVQRESELRFWLRPL